ncbi:hypothetical protein SUGI_1049550 [Cryptomeria japonica]|nr:hypothetical protein SUGI_1049550 [Cryptomeria japonica]
MKFYFYLDGLEKNQHLQRNPSQKMRKHEFLMEGVALIWKVDLLNQKKKRNHYQETRKRRVPDEKHEQLKQPSTTFLPIE